MAAAPETRLTWTQTAPEPGDAHAASLGPYDFGIRATADGGHRLRRGGNPPLRFWEMDGPSLHGAKERAERPANRRVPVISR